MRVINKIRNSIKRTFADCGKNLDRMLLQWIDLYNDCSLISSYAVTAEILEEPGNVMTVTGYPPESDYGEDRILATVKKYDPRAQRV